MNLDPYIPCGVPRQSRGSTQIPSLTGYDPKTVEFKDIDAESIDHEDLDFEPRRIELDRNLGTSPYQIHETCVRISLIETVDEFGQIGADVSFFPVTNAFRRRLSG